MRRPDDVEELELSSDECALLARVAKLLSNLASPRFARLRDRLGYDDAENALAWRLLTEAGGGATPLDHGPRDEVIDRDALLADLDAFENLWLPRAATALNRHLAEARRESVVRAFFQDLERGPARPRTYTVVQTFLHRFEQLPKLDEPGAKRAHQSLVRRGLNSKCIAQVKACLKKFDHVPGFVEPDRVTLERRRAAYLRLRLWHADWSTTLRPEVGHHDALRLGLKRPKGGHRREE